MTAPAPHLPDLAVLDRRLTEALATLRRARIATKRSRNAVSIRAEEEAESRLNGLLEQRQATRHG